jgi:hypothetical protein
VGIWEKSSGRFRYYHEGTVHENVILYTMYTCTFFAYTIVQVYEKLTDLRANGLNRRVMLPAFQRHATRTCTSMRLDAAAENVRVLESALFGEVQFSKILARPVLPVNS